jgi:hypothetical protein
MHAFGRWWYYFWCLILLHRQNNLLKSSLHVGYWGFHWCDTCLLVVQHCFPATRRAFARAFFSVRVISTWLYRSRPTLVNSCNCLPLIFLKGSHYTLMIYLGFVFENWFHSGNDGGVIIFFILYDWLSYCSWPDITCPCRFCPYFLRWLVLIVCSWLISNWF